TTVVVTRRDDWDPGSSEVLLARDVNEAIEAAAAIDHEVFVVGGARVYADALPVADRLELTWVDAEPKGDTHFPAVCWAAWREVRREEADGIAYATYERASSRSPKPREGR